MYTVSKVMPSKNLILCHTLLLSSIFPSIRVFSNENPGQRSEKTEPCWTPSSQESSHLRRGGGIRRKKSQRPKDMVACPCCGPSLLPGSAEALDPGRPSLPASASCSQSKSVAAGGQAACPEPWA